MPEVDTRASMVREYINAAERMAKSGDIVNAYNALKEVVEEAQGAMAVMLELVQKEDPSAKQYMCSRNSQADKCTRAIHGVAAQALASKIVLGRYIEITPEQCKEIDGAMMLHEKWWAPANGCDNLDWLVDDIAVSLVKVTGGRL